MAAIKSTTLTVRIEPALKDSLRAMAERERRSLANMIDVMIRNYCERNGVQMQERK
ncbi:MAG: ribbon-helix-helix protein, CopG family [Pseudomonadota bacterium]